MCPPAGNSDSAVPERDRTDRVERLIADIAQAIRARKDIVAAAGGKIAIEAYLRGQTSDIDLTVKLREHRS